MSERNTFIIRGELYSSKNSREPIIRKTKDGRTIKKVVKSKAAAAHEQRLLQQFSDYPQFRVLWLREIAGTPLPLRIRVKIFRRTRARFDYLNIVQNLFDAMVKAGLLVDDSADHLIPDFSPYEVDSKNPRTELLIL